MCAYKIKYGILISENVIFTLLVIKLVLISVPTIYLSYCYNPTATHKILESRPMGKKYLQFYADLFCLSEPVFMIYTIYSWIGLVIHFSY